MGVVAVNHSTIQGSFSLCQHVFFIWLRKKLTEKCYSLMCIDIGFPSFPYLYIDYVNCIQILVITRFLLSTLYGVFWKKLHTQTKSLHVKFTWEFSVKHYKSEIHLEKFHELYMKCSFQVSFTWNSLEKCYIKWVSRELPV